MEKQGQAASWSCALIVCALLWMLKVLVVEVSPAYNLWAHSSSITQETFTVTKLHYQAEVRTSRGRAEAQWWAEGTETHPLPERLGQRTLLKATRSLGKGRGASRDLAAPELFALHVESQRAELSVL